MKPTNTRYRIIAMILVALLATSMTACSGGSNNQSESESTVTTESDNTSTLEEPEYPPEETNESASAGTVESETDDLTQTQKNSINMLNYMTVLAQKVNGAKGNQLLLESTYTSLVNDIYPNAVDRDTQGRITGLMDTIEKYRMISVKRERLQYIYEQNKAQAMRQAIPNPIGLLSVVQSGNYLKAAISVLYMTADSVSSYKSATSQADLQFLKDGWELDDEEAAELHNNTKEELVYMFNTVRNYDLPGDYALNEEAVKNFVSWSGKSDKELARKIEWLESNKSTYEKFGPYWLELAKDYYNDGDYKKSLDAINQYESVSTRIFRKDLDYAAALPLAIVSARETMSDSEYASVAEPYCKAIQANTKDSDWSLRYFAAQTYMNLYSITKNQEYMDAAYEIAKDNVNSLIDGQKNSNKAYLTDIKKVKADKDATKREKKEVKAYNKLMSEEREIALPPVNEALYLNCDMLYALAKEKGVSDSEKKKLDAMLHGGSDNLFLTDVVDSRFRISNAAAKTDLNGIDVQFDGKKLTLPASCVTDRCAITVNVSGSDEKTKLDDWTISEVNRPKKSKDVSEFTATFKSKKGKKHKYVKGDKVMIEVVPVELSPEKKLLFNYKVKGTKKAFVFKGIKFERVKK